MNPDTCYIAGPMTGYPRYNFDAFDQTARILRDEGWIVINPAEISRHHGVDPDKGDVDPKIMHSIISKDVESIFKVSTVFLLPGWENSTGANAEVALAKWLGKKVSLFCHRITQSQHDKTILKIADQAIRCMKAIDALKPEREELEGMIKHLAEAKHSPID
jgi:hypothetical protein